MSSFGLVATVPAPAGALVGAPPLLPRRPSAEILQSIFDAQPQDLPRALKRLKRNAGDLDDVDDPTAADGLGKRTYRTAEWELKTALRKTPFDDFNGEWPLEAFSEPQDRINGLRKYAQLCNLHAYERHKMELGAPIEETGMPIDEMAQLVISNPNCIKTPEAAPFGQFWGGASSDSCEPNGKHLTARKPMKARNGKKSAK